MSVSELNMLYCIFYIQCRTVWDQSRFNNIKLNRPWFCKKKIRKNLYQKNCMIIFIILTMCMQMRTQKICWNLKILSLMCKKAALNELVQKLSFYQHYFVSIKKPQTHLHYIPNIWTKFEQYRSSWLTNSISKSTFQKAIIPSKLFPSISNSHMLIFIMPATCIQCLKRIH